MTAVRFRPSALADIASIHRYIAGRDPSAARLVAGRIQAACYLLERFPRLGRNGAVEGTFELVVPRLPYIIVYEIFGESVEVVAVFHARQDGAEKP